MDFFIQAFNTILYEPLFNALIFLYQYLPGRDFGVAVIVLTIIIRIVFYPLMVKSIKSQKALSELQPKIQEIQQKYKDDKAKQSKEMMRLYKEEKINPLGGCLPLLLQLPILIALYRVFWTGLEPGAMAHLYSFVPNPGVINSTFFEIIDLSKTLIIRNADGQIIEYYWSALVLAVIAGIAQFFQTKMMIPKTKKIKQGGGQMAQFSGMIQKQMLYFFPIFTVFIITQLPSAIGLYWIITALFSIGQQHLIYKSKPPEGKPSASNGARSKI